MNYVMSDVHGCYREFMEMLQEIEFKEQDKLYILGDVVDRGPNSVKLIKFIMKKPNIYLLMGNHEEMINRTYDPLELNWKYFNSLWRANGGGPTAKELTKLTNSERDEIINYIKSLPITLDISVNSESYHLVHGNYPSTEDIEIGGDSLRDECLWGRVNDNKLQNKPVNQTLVFGHTPTYNYQRVVPYSIWFGDGMIGTDCGLCQQKKGKSRLGCLRLEDKKEFYVNYKGSAFSSI